MEHPTTNDNLALRKYGKQDSRESQENLERLENWVDIGRLIWVQILPPPFPVILFLNKRPSLGASVTWWSYLNH